MQVPCFSCCALRCAARLNALVWAVLCHAVALSLRVQPEVELL